MGNDLRNVFNDAKDLLEQKLQTTKFTPQQKEILRTLLDFGYSAGFCEKTCDMNGGFFQAQKYQDAYNTIKKLLSKK